MGDRKTNTSALYFPEELSLSDTACVVCFGDAKKPVFCTTCRKMFCCDCMVKCQQENGCGVCRSKTTTEVYVRQCDRYRCEQHDLLITMLCTECDICVCKQCLGREAEHSLHAFITIDDIREELCREVEKIYEYKRMVDILKGLEPMTSLASQFAEKCLINIESFSAILRTIEDTIDTFIEEINTYDLKNLIKDRVKLKKRVQNTLDKISTLKRQEPQQIYDFGEPLFEIKQAETGWCHEITANDEHGNEWRLLVHQTNRLIVFCLKLIHGTPGRYEVKIDSTNNSHKFQKVLEFKNFSQRLEFCKIRLETKNAKDVCLTASLRPTNFKYHLQCARLYREIVNTLFVPYSEKMVLITNEMLQTKKSDFFIEDGTGTMWRFRSSIFNHSEISYMSVCLEHYDGAVGKFEFYIQLLNQKDQTKSTKLVKSRRFYFGSEYRIKKFVVLSNQSECFFDLQRGIQLIIGLRPTANNLSYLRRCFNSLSK